METGVPYALALFSVAEAGAVAVPLNSRFTVRELAYEVENSGSKILILGQDYLEVFFQNRSRFKSLEHVVIHGKSGPPEIIPVEELMDEGQSKNFDPVRLIEDDLVMIMYTSGTTGFPKGAMQTLSE
jgi:acyl-coenzyme A synthetase/AMP-(fatty) acid ligase